MPAPILPISAGALPQPIKPVGGATAGGGFQDVFASAIQNVEQFGQQANTSVERFLSGEGEELHSMVLATQKAELSFDLFQQVRNKVVSAYQEVMRMQM
jgi:flagellar hook-basal body complex protein FliE